MRKKQVAVPEHPVEQQLATADAQHPLRRLAIEILEALDEQMGHSRNFPKGEAWYAAEDRIVERLTKLNAASNMVTPEVLNRRFRRALEVITSTLDWLANGGLKQAGKQERIRDIKNTLHTMRDLGHHTLSLDQPQGTRRKVAVREGRDSTMPSFQITLVESQTVLSTYRVDAENMDEALATLAENGNREECVDGETLENTFMRFRCIWDPGTGEERPVTDEENKQLLKEGFIAGV